MIYSEYIAYLKSIADTHVSIANGKLVNGVARASFFRMNDEMEVQQQVPTGVDYPAMFVSKYFGNFNESNGPVMDAKTGGLR